MSIFFCPCRGPLSAKNFPYSPCQAQNPVLRQPLEGRGVKPATDAFFRSGQLNAKQRELAELQALAQRRLKGVRANVSEGLEAAREARRDLDYTQKKVS